jgi:hypothetical protein
MKSVLAGVLASGMVAASALATNVNISVKVDGGPSNGQNAITVPANTVVNFRIEATLTDNLNEGLALIGFDLDHTGGNLAANTIQDPTGPISCANPMQAFDKPDGITNPAGFMGTLINGDLIQIGGGQNTIKNTADNADFPIGNVLPGVAQPAGCGTAVVAKGSLTAAASNGVYSLNVLNLFANVIKDNETGTVFWATEAAGVGTITNLAITVGPAACQDTASVASSAPADQGSLWRTAKNIVRFTISGTPLPGVPVIEIREMLTGGAVGPDLSASFNKTLESGGTVLRLHDTGGNLVHRRWYVVRNTACDNVVDFSRQFVIQAGDADANRFVTAVDVGLINSAPQGVVADNSRFDIDGNGFRTAVDVGLANANQGGLPAKPTGW